MRRLIWTLIAVVAVSVFLFVLAPPAPAHVGTAGWDDLAARTVAGAYHVHTVRSDGHGNKAAVAAAAARAGLRFVILTDHGDGTRPPDPPAYMNGVLMLDAVEISTDDGHYVALDMPRAPYPLGGAGDAVVEDVHRLGGFGMAAHPDSPKIGLRWSAEQPPIDGIEWLNADSEWRDETRATLVRAGLGYFLRPAAALAMLLDRPATLDRWDALLRRRRVIALAGADAHGGAGRPAEDQNRTFFAAAGIPSYDASFRELSVRCVLEHVPAGSAGEDARAIFAAIRQGHVFSAIDALAAPALLDFHAASSGGGTVTLEARAAMPPGGELVLIGPDGEMARGAGELRYQVPTSRPAAYRVEGRLPSAPGQPAVPWLVSNPIYVGDFGETGTVEPVPAIVAGGQLPWRIEKDPASSAILRTPGQRAELEYHLADGPRANQFVALATDLHAQSFAAIDLAVASDRPARIGVQVRDGDGRRWGRSYYVGSAGTSIHARLSDFRAIGAVPPVPPRPELLSSVLVVADLINATPGHSGRLVLASSALVK